MPDSGLFSTDAFRRVLNRVIRDEGPRSCSTIRPAAIRRFVHLSTYLLRFGLEGAPEEILIVTGSQQGST
jgi:DNA-binding transcriptional MocR family regulator